MIQFEALSCSQIRRLPPIPFDKFKSLSLLVIIMWQMMSDFKISLKMTRFNVFINIFKYVLCFDTNLARIFKHQNWHNVSNLHIIYYVKVLTFLYFCSAHTNISIVNHFIKDDIIDHYFTVVCLLWLKELKMMPMWREASITRPLCWKVWCVSWHPHKDHFAEKSDVSHDIHTKTIDNCQSYIYNQKWHVWHYANVKINVNKCQRRLLWPNVTCLTWYHHEGKHKINKSHLLDKHKRIKGNTYTMPPNPHNLNKLHPHLQWHWQIGNYIIAQFLAPHKS
jgi:hypothetical protein